MLVLLDLSAAFDTVDHGILLERLQVTFGVGNSALAWFRSYLAGRRQHVVCGGKRSALTDVICGVPQGSVLGSILSDLASIIAEHGLSVHQYADDSQIYGSCQSDATASLSNTVSQCVDSTSNWMRSNRLQLNADKTEAMWCSSTYPAARSLLLVYSFVLSTPFVTCVYLSTTILVQLLTLGELCHAASPR